MDARQKTSGMTERKSFPQSSGGNPGPHLSFPLWRESRAPSVIPALAGIQGPLCHSRNLLAGIQEKQKHGCPTENLGHDRREPSCISHHHVIPAIFWRESRNNKNMDARQRHSGMTEESHSRNLLVGIQGPLCHSRNLLAGIQKKQKHGCPTGNFGHDRVCGCPTGNFGHDKKKVIPREGGNPGPHLSFPQSSGGNPGKTKTWMPDRQFRA